MNTEFEAKFYPVDKTQIRKKLKELGARLVQEEILMKIVLFGNRGNSGMKVHYIRLRDEGNKVTFTAKIHAREGEEVSDQKELETTVENFEAAKGILEAAGLLADHIQEKYRETWELDQAEIVIDTWPDLDPYIEIEAESEKIVKQVAEKLNFNWEEKIITSVTEIYAQKFNVSFEDALERTQNLTFASGF